MASGIFTLKQQELALSLNAWSGQKTPVVDYLVVAGGGGGAGVYGAGGAGGLLQGSIAVATGTSITVTVGAGGGGSASTLRGSSGNSSVFGSISTTGGGGAGADATGQGDGLSGGSGGGAGEGAAGNNPGGQGVAGQGNAGGNTGPDSTGAGGGGAGSKGLNNASTTVAGSGGVGVASGIPGDRTAYAGGGGGGGFGGSGVAGVGGAGGGGNGGAFGGNNAGGAGTANTGGGGGGGSFLSNYGGGGAGGSGVVIISYPDIYPAATSTSGSPTVSTSGSGAISFSGTSQYLQYADNAAFTMGSGDFTVECWIYRLATGRMFVCGQCDSSGTNSSTAFGLLINSSDQLEGRLTSGSTIYYATAASTFTNNAWIHIAFVRDGNTTRIYSGGVQVGTANVTGVTANDSSNRLGVGALGELTSSLLNGYITNLRIVKGTCLYPSGTTFTPSTTPLTAISGTSLLLSAMSGAFSADSSTNAFFAAALGNSPTWVDSSPFSVTGYKNRVYKWTSSGSITF